MNSLRRQLIFGLLFAFLVLLGSGGSFVYWSVRRSLYGQFDASLRLKALIVVRDTQISNNKVHVSFSERFLREFDKEFSVDFFQVFTADGKSIAGSTSLQNWNLPFSLHGSVTKPVFWNLTLRTGEPGRAIGILFQPRLATKNDTSQDVVVVVATNRRPLVETIVDLRNGLLGCGGALILLTGFVVPWVLRRSLRPLNDLAEHANRIEAESLGQRFPVEVLPIELKPIAGRLNDLLLRLEASFERERRFGSDLAHELRTPLAELRSLSEVALKWPQDRPADTDEAVLEISLQMETLVGRLLTLTRAEQGRILIKPETVALAPLFEAIVKPLGAGIAKRHLTLELAVPTDASLETDAVLFRSIVANLVENAVEYSPSGEAVRISFTGDSSRFSLQISNRAPNLQAEDLPRMFDRLWRKDIARADTNHSGLGLAMARSFTKMLGFALEPSLAADGRLVMTLRGPVI